MARLAGGEEFLTIEACRKKRVQLQLIKWGSEKSETGLTV
ncbi:hypothetical protein [Escherichia coli ISC7]|uniref:Uncharacterized protein n=1 Tax=Escherichia coli ISC7 TaxID=1432555 RepID=W1F358_ECOLX|nr:hypothetical protein [Escherichia coli ISC7]